jgi:hypothetical protein
MYGYRERLVLNLVRAGISLNLYGPSPSSWSNPATKAMHTGMYLDEKTKARLFFEALGCLNTFAPAERDSLNCRVFDPDSEFLEFDSMEELLQILEKLKSDPGLGMRVRLEGMAKAHSHHTYAKRLSAIFRTLGLKYAE